MSLIPAMIFLLVLAVLSASALNNGVMQERMAGSARDMNVAFQAAEAALRDAETDIAANVNSTTAFTSTCSAGLCTPPSTWAQPSSTDISQLIDWSNPAVTRRYGGYTGVPALDGVAAQPLYVVERLATLPVSAGGSVGLGIAAPNSGGIAYRVTVLATGAREGTRITLQSTFVQRQS